jgi:hypothetical protein
MFSHLQSTAIQRAERQVPKCLRPLVLEEVGAHRPGSHSRRGPASFGISDTFDDEDGRNAYLTSVWPICSHRNSEPREILDHRREARYESARNSFGTRQHPPGLDRLEVFTTFLAVTHLKVFDRCRTSVEVRRSEIASHKPTYKDLPKPDSDRSHRDSCIELGSTSDFCAKATRTLRNSI